MFCYTDLYELIANLHAFLHTVNVPVLVFDDPITLTYGFCSEDLVFCWSIGFRNIKNDKRACKLLSTSNNRVKLVSYLKEIEALPNYYSKYTVKNWLKLYNMHKACS